MIVEVRPGAFSNKGGELMMHAVLARLAPRHRLVVEPWIADYQQRARLGLYQKLWVRRLGIVAGLPATVIPARARALFGIVAEPEIGAVLDASGFRYSSDDRFGLRSTRELARNALRWRRQGKVIVLLPQALGPFNGAEARSAFLAALDAVDLVYARDAASLEHLQALDRHSDKTRLAPDITIGLDGIRPRYLSELIQGRRFGCLIPNTRMVERASAQSQDRYMAFLVGCITSLTDLDLLSVVALHETVNDRWIVDRLRQEVGDTFATVTEADPRLLKGIVGAATLVISSRFHGLVNALSQSVPVLATGWTHKYRGLLEDFGCADNLIEPSIDGASLRRALEALISEPTRQRMISTMSSRAKTMRRALDAMWTDLEARLNGRDRGPRP